MAATVAPTESPQNVGKVGVASVSRLTALAVTTLPSRRILEPEVLGADKFVPTRVPKKEDRL